MCKVTPMAVCKVGRISTAAARGGPGCGETCTLTLLNTRLSRWARFFDKRLNLCCSSHIP